MSRKFQIYTLILIAAMGLLLPFKAAALDAEQIDLLSEEGWLLWKLERYDEVKALVDDAPTEVMDHESFLSLASLIHIHNQDLDGARPYIDALRQAEISNQRIIRDYDALVLMRSHDWKQAQSVYKNLMNDYPDNIFYKNQYLLTLVNMNRWREAKQFIVAHPQSTFDDLTSDYRRILRVGGGRLAVRAKTLNGPVGLSHRFLDEEIQWWLNDDLRIAFGGAQNYVSRDSRVGLDPISEFFGSHRVMVESYVIDNSVIEFGLQTYYLQKDVIYSPEFEITNKTAKFDHLLKVVLNEFIFDPIEGVRTQSKKDTVHYDVRMKDAFSFTDLELVGKVDIGYELSSDQYYMSSYLNTLSGESDLGSRIRHSYYVDRIIWDIPFISLQYRYVSSKWDQATQGVETLVPYLDDESLHVVGFYNETELTDDMRFQGGIYQGRDRKRDVHLTTYSASVEWWLNSEWVLSWSLEYNYGDSGTLGSGNTMTQHVQLEYLW